MGIVVSLLFLGIAIRNTLLTELINLVVAQAKGTKETKEAAKKIFN